MGVGLVEHVLQMGFHRSQGHSQFIGDRLQAVPAQHAGGDQGLGLGESVQPAKNIDRRPGHLFGVGDAI